MTEQEFRATILAKLATLEERSQQQAEDIREIKESMKGNTVHKATTELARFVGAVLAGVGGGYLKGVS